MKIGVFDTGKGGELVYSILKDRFLEHDFILVTDGKHLPYGDKSNNQILRFTDEAIQQLIDQCEIIVIACNTATAAAIDQLRKNYPAIDFIGFEPMLKPAIAISSTRHITVLATKATIQSERYKRLRNIWCQNSIVDEPDTKDWAKSIELSKGNSIVLDEVSASIESGSDTIVLACTHYLALLPKLKVDYPNTNIMEPVAAVAERLSQLIALRQQQTARLDLRNS